MKRPKVARTLGLEVVLVLAFSDIPIECFLLFGSGDESNEVMTAFGFGHDFWKCAAGAICNAAFENLAWYMKVDAVP